MSKHCLENTDRDMSLPIPVDILSDSDSDDNHRRKSPPNDAIDLVTPPQFLISKKKQKTEGVSNPRDCSVFVIDEDEVTPRQDDKWIESSPIIVCETPFSVTPECSGRNISSFSAVDLEERVVADTPMSELLKFEATIVKCNKGVASSEPACSLMSNRNSAEITGTICVDSDDSEDVNDFGAWKHNKIFFASKSADNQELDSSAPSVFHGSFFQVHPLRDCSHERSVEDDISMVHDKSDDKAGVSESVDHISKKSDDPTKFKKLSKEDKLRLIEEKKQQKEREKLLKAESKAEAAKMKKLEKEMKKWEKGKYALKCIVAEIDKKVVELGSIGGNMLTRFAEKGLQYRITSNPVERTIMWTMAIPEDISMIPREGIEISYVLVVYEAEEFCNLVVNDSLMDHVQRIQHSYPNYTVCYLTNRLMAYINKREQAQYKNAANYPDWKRPAIEEVLAKLATNFFKVHSRHCIDEMELAEHVVGLTCSLASCQFRKRLTRLSVNANGSVIPKDCVDKNLIKKNVWLKALVAIPKVQPRFAIAIWKKYPTMKSLLSVYMDPTKSVHEKEFVLKDLTTEGLFGDDRRLGEVCSKRIYRILMAQSGSIKTDDVENGADFFSHAST